MGTKQPTTHDVVLALLAQVVLDDVHEKRRNRRRACFACFGGISVSAVVTYDSEYRVGLVAAVTNDISQEGLSFFCPRLLHVETPLSIRFLTLEDRPVLKCVVRNVVHLGGEYHRIGVEFTE